MAKKVPTNKEAPAKPDAVAKKANPFIGKRDTKQAPLHAEPAPELMAPKAKSFSFYPEDFTRLDSLRKKFTDRSGTRHVPDSVIVRVALAYLEDQLNANDGKTTFERQFRDFLLEHR